MGTDFSTIKAKKFTEYLTYLFIGLPPLIYFLLVNKFAINIPYYDDYPSVLQFLNDYKKSAGADRFFLLFSQYNEHRIFFTRFIITIYYSIFGNVNFRDIIFIGNAQLIIILLLSVHFIKKALPYSWKLPSILISLFIFDITNWQNADWAMASLQNYGIILLFFVTLYFYSLDKKIYFVLGVLFQLLCTFSSGNGIIASFCVVLFAIFSKDKRKMFFAITAFLIFSPIYFIHYKFHQSDKFVLHDYLFSLFHIISGHFNVGRRNYDDYMNELLSLIYLIGLFAFLPMSKKLTIKKENLPIVAIFVFILATMAVICRFRVISGAVQSRYIIYCHYLTGILFLFYLLKLQQHKRNMILSATFTVIMLLCYERNFKIGYDGFSMWQQCVIHNTPDRFTPSDPAIEKAIVNESCRLNIYCMQQQFYK